MTKEEKEKFLQDHNMVFIPNFEERYGIDKDGNIWSFCTNAYLTCHINHSGYKVLQLQNDNGYKDCFLHRLLAITYIPNPENKPTVDHINRDRKDNRLENLRWATPLEQHNNQDNEWFENNHDKLCEFASKVTSKPVEMRDINNHNIILKTFSSSYQAAIQEFGDSTKNSLINRCARGKRKSAYGYFWTYVE